MYDPARGKGAAFDDVEPAAAGTDFRRLHGEWRKADEAVAEMDFADTFDVGGEAFSLRMVYVHMIGEYSRHNGHAGLLRDSTDGLTVDDPNTARRR